MAAPCSAVAVVLEEPDRYIREGLGGSAARRLGGSAARRLGGSAVALVLDERSRYIREWPGSSWIKERK